LFSRHSVVQVLFDRSAEFAFDAKECVDEGENTLMDDDSCLFCIFENLGFCGYPSE